MMGHVSIQNKDEVASSVLDSVNVCSAWKGGKMNIHEYKNEARSCPRLVLLNCASVPYPIPAFLREVSTAIVRKSSISEFHWMTGSIDRVQDKGLTILSSP